MKILKHLERGFGALSQLCTDVETDPGKLTGTLGGARAEFLILNLVCSLNKQGANRSERLY